MSPVYALPRSKACQNCAAAKVKCEPAIGYTKCKRCNNQNVACVLSAAEPRKRKRAESSIVSGSIAIPMGVVNGSASPGSCRLFEIERGMYYYRTSLFEFFPFVIMPDVRQPAADFASTKPCMALMVAMLGCTKDRARQRELTAHARAYIATHMVQKGQKSLDLLQGLLLLIHWSQLQLELRGQRSIFMHMAMSLLVDLHLNRSPFARRHFVTATEGTDGFELRTEYHAENLAEKHTLEERRAFLGCIYLSSVMSNTSVNLNPVKFNDYAEQCCDVLEKSGIDTDQTLISLCRLQHSVEQFRVVNCWFNMTQRQRGSGYEFIYNIFRQSSSSEDILHHVRNWDAKISAQWNATPEIVKTRLLTIQYGYARVCLYECCLEESLFPSAEARHEVLRNCISAIRFLNDALVPISLDPLVLLDVPAHIFAQSNHNTFLALLLCSVKCGDNCTETVDRELKLRDYFARTSARLGALLDEPLDEIPAFYRKLIPMARGVQKWFAAKLRTGEEVADEMDVDSRVGASGSDLDVDFWGQFLNMDGDEWLQDILSMDHSG
ncbi:uncharacterized protein CC84DRAFT_1264194 [Paraphaeosphaeria sporulosa]|uniref:Zn(2)-C6 fungal-type domain-containing protein n=1 Tax=Paraphaeosphaeria sporulosa TaxID=1460663 RepID=A0A177BWW9_9PLEO|nr:uncharacterized protein CC84DRAFT_1264194 [Paraphaeosphaeria sporulosa]OAF99178.1 hypothetical protein CC84DRAFT_1264194 [Paraphaeosphaeria sporulosa]